MSAFSPRIVPERRGRMCKHCKDRGHKEEDCPYRPGNEELREKIADRQARPWRPRFTPSKY